MDNKGNDKMMNSAERMRDSIIEKRQREVERHQQLICERLQKEWDEQGRVQRSNDFAQSMLEKARAKESEKQRIRQAEREEQERRELGRRVTENLNLKLGE